MSLIYQLIINSPYVINFVVEFSLPSSLRLMFYKLSLTPSLFNYYILTFLTVLYDICHTKNNFQCPFISGYQLFRVRDQVGYVTIESWCLGCYALK